MPEERSHDNTSGTTKPVDPRNKLNDLSAVEWIAETVSVYVQRGLGRGHKDAQIERQHPAPFSFQDVERLVRFFTKKGGTVLDPFCGVASTLKACALSGRRGVGIELNPRYVELAGQRMATEVPPSALRRFPQEIIEGDALEVIDRFATGRFDFLVTSPPYWSILRKVDHKVRQERVENGLDVTYGDDKRDLANISDYASFLEVLAGFFERCARVLRPRAYVCIVVSDFREKDRFTMYHADLANRLESGGHYVLKGITVIYQKYKRVFPYGYPFAYVPNIHHQYVLILQKRM